jgi:transposase
MAARLSTVFESDQKDVPKTVGLLEEWKDPVDDQSLHTCTIITQRAKWVCLGDPCGAPHKAHARRKFFDAVKLNPKNTTSIQIVAQMDEFFGVDAQARQEGLSQIDRHVLRLDKSKPLLEEIKTSIQAARTGALPKSALAKACDYTLTLWSRLSRFLEYPELELSNNLAENAMRPVALGRRNRIHVGSKEAEPRVAAIISIVETCRLPLRDYLSSVLPGLADFPSNRVAELTPEAWATRI